MYQPDQQQPWMYDQMNQQQWMPQDGFYAQQPVMPPMPQPQCDGVSCLIDLDAFSDMSSDSETDSPAASKKAAKVIDDDAALQRVGSVMEPAAEPAPVDFVEAKLGDLPSVKSIDSVGHTEATSVPGSPGCGFDSSASEPDAEASIKCESDFTDSDFEEQPGELFTGGA